MQTMSTIHNSNYIIAIILALFVALFGDSIANINKVHANAFDDEQNVKVIKIETEVKSLRGGDNEEAGKVEVKVLDNNEKARIFTFDGSALDDLAQVEFELSELDPETQQTVMNVLEQVKNQDFEFHLDEASKNLEQIFILENEKIEATEEALRILGESHNLNGDVFKFIQKSSSKSISRMIEKGDFTQEQLDQIQRALDSKR
jgi:hypothetical protein